MKILFGSFQAITILEGGVKTQVLALKEELRKLGQEVLLFDAWENYQAKDIALVHLFCAHIGTYHLAKSIQALGHKLVLTPVFYSRQSPRLIRSVLTVTKPFSKIGIVYPYMITHELCSMANIVAPNTQKEMTLVEKGLKISATRIKLLPNGVDERFYNSNPSMFVNKYGIKDFILYVGHIGWQRKNLLPLLKICQKIDKPLVLIGKVIQNDYGNQCLEIIKSRRNTILITDLEHADPTLASAYAACDTLVLPSYYETPGLVALEAGLAGAKIVITKYGGTDEYFQDYATYIDPRSAKSIRGGIIKSFEQKKNPALKEYIKNNFLWKHAAEKLLMIYQTLVSLGRI
jgi:glycosyltransferase involved in cell wall biosynthesis